MSAGATMRRTWPVLVSYAIFSMWGISCFLASIVMTAGGFGLEANAWAAVAGILAAVAVGHVIGNVLGLSGFRLVPVSIIFFALFMLSTLSGVALGVFAVFLIIAVIAAYGGYLGIASRLDVVASWYPLTFCVGGAIIWMNAHKAVATFNSGAKYALWDAFTIVCLAGGVFWMLVFLATRNALSLTVWQEVARPKMTSGEDAVAVARPGRGSLLVLMAFTIAVLGATALVSPYLFRTEKGDGKDNGSQQADDDEGQGKGQGQGDGSGYKGKKTKGHGKARSTSGGGDDGEGQGQGKGKGKGKQGKDGQPIDDPDTEGAKEAAEEAAKLGLKILAYLLAAAALLLFFYLVVLPPIRRSFLLRHLEKPIWPIPPTTRAMNHWRRALAVLAVAGIEPSAGETATDFAKRARAELLETHQCESPGLEEAAAIVERIAYAGRGLGTEDEKTVNEAITRFVTHVRPHLKLRRRFASVWGRAPEVDVSD